MRFFKFLRKPTVAAQYKGQKLKRLLDQRWTGHLDTVSVVLKSHNTLVEFLNEIATTRKGADIKLEAVGLHKAITEPAFKFLSCVMYKVLGLMDPPNRMLQAEQTDLMTAVQLIRSASSCIESLRSDAEFAKLWAESIKSSDDAVPTAPKRQRQASKSLQDYIVNESVGQRESNIEQECKRLFFNIIDSILGEMSVRFSERNSQYMSALDALDPGTKNFLDAGK
ncbi:zinc finger MYM-type 1-like protein [Labeo rohita]|uniref:Zinc finger MYM-type 1-like protein n=1 Tax=Labeo rohita TaxID=84645 RepID=A0A498NDR1_LABRO|nr:zinc finger MYM-type 1-like protein [Labeo rohita]